MGLRIGGCRVKNSQRVAYRWEVTYPYRYPSSQGKAPYHLITVRTCRVGPGQYSLASQNTQKVLPCRGPNKQSWPPPLPVGSWPTHAILSGSNSPGDGKASCPGREDNHEPRGPHKRHFERLPDVAPRHPTDQNPCAPDPAFRCFLPSHLSKPPLCYSALWSWLMLGPHADSISDGCCWRNL